MRITQSGPVGNLSGGFGARIIQASGSPPVNTAAPVISSSGDITNPHPGDVLTITMGDTYSGTAPITKTHQWVYAGSGTPVASGSTAGNCTIESGDIGNQIQVVSTGTNAFGSANASSNSTGTVAAAIGYLFRLASSLGVFTDTAGTSPASNGDAAANWSDATTASGLAITQSTSGNRPILSTSAKALTFDGSNDALAGTLTPQSAGRIYAVAKFSGSAGATLAFFAWGDGGGHPTLWLGVLSGNFTGSMGVTGTDLSGPASDSNAHLFELDFRTGYVSFILDGIAVSCAPGLYSGGASSFVVGNYATGSLFWPGDVSEIDSLQNPSASLRSLLLSTYGVIAGTNPLQTWSFITFDNATQAVGRPRLLTGTDGVNWTEIGIALPLSSADSPATGGDYSQMILNGKYYCAYTRTRAITTSLSSFGLSVAADGLEFLQQPDVDCSAISGLVRCWAPEFFVDHDGSVYIHFAGSLTSPYDATKFTIYRLPVTDITANTFGTPVAVDGIGFASLVGSYIDPFCILVAGVYYIWAKNEVTDYVEVFSSSTLTGLFTLFRVGDWMGIGHCEGSTIELINSGATWRFYGDDLDADATGIRYWDQTVGAGDWTGTNTTSRSAWTALSATSPFTPRHGTPLLIQ